MIEKTLSTGLRIAVVGLEFGAEFPPIYKAHPDVAEVVICDHRKEQLNLIGDRLHIERRYLRLDDVLAEPDIDAVHLVTPVTLHGRHSIAVLESGKHCACTIPAALSIDELKEIVRLERMSGLTYMMMETSVYTREFLYVQDLVRRGAFGDLAFARGSHLQDMTGWPDYWMGFPPLSHITHALGPVLALLGTRATKVHCFGSGILPEAMTRQYENPFPVETAIFRLEDTKIAAEVTRCMFRMARPYTESFAIYGDKLGFEWAQLEEETPCLFAMEPQPGKRGNKVTTTRIDVPDRPDLLPAEIAGFTQRSVHSENGHLSFVQGGGHGGSHPHLVHEFVRSVVEGRKSRIDAITAANWSAAGLAAHQSAMTDGAGVEVPRFD